MRPNLAPRSLTLSLAAVLLVGIACAVLSSGSVRADTVPADSLFARGERALEADDIDGAESHFREALDLDDDDHRALNGLALVGIARGDAGFAIEYARKAVRKDRKNSDYHMTLAMAYGTRLMQGGFSSMIYVGKFKKECETAVRLDPSNVEAHMALLQYYAMAPGLMGGSMERARETAETVASLDPFLGHIADAVLAHIGGDLKAAEASYTAAAHVDTTDPEGWGALGMFLMDTGQCREAVPIGERVVRLAPDDWQAPYQLGKAHLVMEEDLDESERWFEMAIDLMSAKQYPDRHMLASAQWRLGMIEEKRGDLDAARAHWELALEIEEGHEEASAALESVTTVLPEGR